MPSSELYTMSALALIASAASARSSNVQFGERAASSAKGAVGGFLTTCAAAAARRAARRR